MARRQRQSGCRTTSFLPERNFDIKIALRPPRHSERSNRQNRRSGIVGQDGRVPGRPSTVQLRSVKEKSDHEICPHRAKNHLRRIDPRQVFAYEHSQRCSWAKDQKVYLSSWQFYVFPPDFCRVEDVCQSVAP